MADGQNDIVGLFQRVTALEQSDVNADQTLAAIVKNYSTLEISITISTLIHDYRLACDFSDPTLIGIRPLDTLYPSATLYPNGSTDFFDYGSGYPANTFYPSDSNYPPTMVNINYLVDGVITATDCYI